MSTIESVLNGVFRPVAALLSDAGEVGDVRDENSRLRLENEELRNQVAELQQNSEEIKGLRDALALTQGDTSVKYVAADVVHRDASLFTDVVTINRGSSDGIDVLGIPLNQTFAHGVFAVHNGSRRPYPVVGTKWEEIAGSVGNGLQIDTSYWNPAKPRK